MKKRRGSHTRMKKSPPQTGRAPLVVNLICRF
nr:MAG TPA: hypothetical protein [Caudoviricetes sp.]